MKEYQRKSKMTELKHYCHLSKEYDVIEVTEWHNGEGFDVYLHADSDTRRFSLSWGEFEALQACVAYKG